MNPAKKPISELIQQIFLAPFQVFNTPPPAHSQITSSDPGVMSPPTQSNSFEDTLKCTANYTDDVIFNNGIMTFCAVYGRPHFFILVEDQDNTIAFSYVPKSTQDFIAKTYTDADDSIRKYKPTVDSDTLSGYNPIAFTTSHVVDTWKLTDKFVRLFKKDFIKWRYRPYDDLNMYNVFSFIPYFGITDCIGYSLRHFIDCKST
jgi:hypothetical protein